jgi:outer membrane protein
MSLLAAFALALPILTACESQRIVYVDTGAMFSKVKVFTDVRDSVMAFNETWKAPAMALKDSVDQYMQKLSAMKTAVSDKERAALEKEFLERQQRLQTFSEANQKKAAEKETALTEAAVKKTNALLQEYCEKQKYDIILGTTVNGSILAANRGLDVTEDVIRYLNEQIK